MGVKAIILFLPLAVLCALCGPVQAEDSAPVQDEPEPYDENLLRSSYYECMEKAGGKTPEEMKCIRLETAYWEKRLDENFNRILKRRMTGTAVIFWTVRMPGRSTGPRFPSMLLTTTGRTMQRKLALWLL